jgi:hypothetical protein
MYPDYSVTRETSLTLDAYAAGLVDGEGCVYVTNAARKGVGQKSYSITVEIGMSVKALGLLRMMKREYGGTIKLSRPATEKWSEAHAWTVVGERAESCLLRLLPYLILKQEQARVALRVMEIRRGLVPEGGITARWTSEAAARCEAARMSIQEMNRKGPEPTTSEPPIPGRFVARLVGDQWVTNQGSLFSDTGWEPFSGPWPNSGFGGPGGFWTRNTSESPSGAVASSLSDVLETGPHLLRYCLSPTAASGILRRAARRERVLPAALLAALESVASTATPPPPSREVDGGDTA